jgi:hypothetical protein
MQQYPGSPGRHRRSSGFSQRPRTVSQSSISNSLHSRKSSNHSLYSPGSPLTPTGFDHGGFGGLDGVDEERRGSTRGLGSLADELAEEGWVESGQKLVQKDNSATGSSADNSRKNKRRSRIANGYEGADYGEDDLEAVNGISTRLEHWMSAVEALARLGTGDSDTKEHGVVPRVRHEMKNLSSQSTLEEQIRQLLKSTVAVERNLMYQSGLLITLTRPVVSAWTPPPDPETAEGLSELVSTLLLSIPRPATEVAKSLQKLRDTGFDLAKDLPPLVDTCTVTLHSTNEAKRCLHSATEKVALLRKELEEAEETQRWLERERWDERLRNREAGKTCREVVEGFEKVCEQWRERIARGGTAGPELAAAS